MQPPVRFFLYAVLNRMTLSISIHFHLFLAMKERRPVLLSGYHNLENLVFLHPKFAGLDQRISRKQRLLPSGRNVSGPHSMRPITIFHKLLAFSLSLLLKENG